jgi:hypothetical protein
MKLKIRIKIIFNSKRKFAKEVANYYPIPILFILKFQQLAKRRWSPYRFVTNENLSLNQFLVKI